jgi:hypothetical protein
VTVRHENIICTSHERRIILETSQVVEKNIRLSLQKWDTELLNVISCGGVHGTSLRRPEWQRYLPQNKIYHSGVKLVQKFVDVRLNHGVLGN